MTMELTMYLEGQGLDIHQQYAYFGDIYRTTFEDQREEQEVTQGLSHLPVLEPSAFNSKC